MGYLARDRGVVTECWDKDLCIFPKKEVNCDLYNMQCDAPPPSEGGSGNAPSEGGSENQVCFDWTVKSQWWGKEMGWSIDGTSCKGGQYRNFDEQKGQCCVPAGGKYVLKCTDTYGDGWNFGAIEIYGKSYCSEFTHGGTYRQSFEVQSSNMQSSNMQSTEPNCIDDTNFVDNHGYDCHAWKSYNCDDTYNGHYTISDVQQVQKSCPKSCGLCGTCKDDPTFMDKLGYPCKEWTGYHCTHTSDWHYGPSDLQDIQKACPRACGSC